MRGAVGPMLDLSAGSVTHTLNDHDEVEVTCSRASLDGVEAKWWSPRSGCLIVTYEDGTGEERIVSAAPIDSPPKEDRQASTVTLSGKGVSWLFEARPCIDENSVATSGDWRSTKFAYTNLSFAALIGNILNEAMRVPSGYLPLIVPDPSESGTHQRTYEAWNLANNMAWKRISEITEVIGGPDVAFRAEWADEHKTRFQWRAIVGTDAQQTLPQESELLWDATSPLTEVADIEVTSEADLVYRGYVTGDGEGAGVAVSIANAKSIPEDMPFACAVASVSGEEETESTKGKAEALIATEGLDQISMTVHADPVRAPIGTWWCGETCVLAVAGFLMVPDGEHRLRVISAKYSLGSDIVSLECQEDQLGDEYTW